jgi:DNA modification methylase
MTTPAMPTLVHSVRISTIIVKDARQRKDMGDVEGLADSILRNGLLQPIILTRTEQLIAGERRLEAFRMNGVTHIPALYRDELDELTLESLELDENIQRKQLTWQEEQAAIARLHVIKQKQNPGWSQAQTATIIAKPGAAAPQQRDVSQAMMLDKMMKLFPEIAEAKTKAQALNMAVAKAKAVNRKLDVEASPSVYAAVEQKIILGDSVEVIKTVADESFDAIITDPPFGVDYDTRIANTVGAASSYKDSAKKYERILSMAPDMYRVLKKDGWLLWFFGISWYERVKFIFRDAGFTVDEIPVIWDRSEGRCFTNVPVHYFTKGYDVALHAFKGDPHLVQKNKPNIVRIAPVSGDERELVVERPVELYQEFIRRMTIPGQIVADFFTGSGSCPAACASLKRDYFAVEQDADRRAVAIQKVQAHTPA